VSEVKVKHDTEAQILREHPTGKDDRRIPTSIQQLE
jgi:hypothetical protein